MANTYPSAPALQTRFVTKTIADVSTAGSYFVVPGFACKVKKIVSVLGGAVATADVDLSFEIGGTAITGGGITIAYDGSAAGDVDTAVPTAANVVGAEEAIELITDGASTNTVEVTVTFEVDPI